MGNEVLHCTMDHLAGWGYAEDMTGQMGGKGRINQCAVIVSVYKDKHSTIYHFKYFPLSPHPVIAKKRILPLFLESGLHPRGA